jgi:hypothetical protein
MSQKFQLKKIRYFWIMRVCTLSNLIQKLKYVSCGIYKSKQFWVLMEILNLKLIIMVIFKSSKLFYCFYFVINLWFFLNIILWKIIFPWISNLCTLWINKIVNLDNYNWNTHRCSKQYSKNIDKRMNRYAYYLIPSILVFQFNRLNPVSAAHHQYN